MLFALILGGQDGCAKRPPTSGGQVLRISQRNEPATLDPHLATLPDEFFIIRALSEGLLSPSPDGGAPHPAGAESWSVSPEGLVYTFHLRRDARWSNGDPVTAADFVYSIHRVLSPALGAPKAPLFYPLKNARAFYSGREKNFSAVGVKAINEHELEFTLAEPTADFPAMVASGPWIPVHQATIEKNGTMDARDSQWTSPPNFVGNGPFTLTAWRPNQEITVTRSKIYRDATQVHLQEIRFVAFDNGDSEERAFRAGQLDVTMAVPFSKIATYREMRPSPLHTLPLAETRFLSLNVNRPPLNDVRVRRALSLALDREALTGKILRGGQRPAFSYVPPDLGGYSPATLLTENAATARQLLAEAGYPGGKNFPKLELTSWATTPAVLEAIQQMWHRELGIEINLVQREARTHLAALAVGDYAIALATVIPDYDGASDAFDYLLSGNPLNYPHWSSPDYDRLVRAAARTTSNDARNATYQHAERILLGELPLIPLYFNAQNFLLQPRVKNWEADRLWTRFYPEISVK
ncbi:MAG TPA: peptide ABC transporter substrate-binding protein [Lacunisphaera sp.]